MAITRVQSKTANSTASVSSLFLTFDSALTAGNLVVLAAAGPAVTLTLGSATGVTSLIRVMPGPSTTDLLLAVCRIFSGAPASFIVNTGTSGNLAIVAAEYSGLSGAFDRYAEASGTSSSPDSGAAATSDTANQLWVGGIAARNAVTVSAPLNGFSIVGQAASSVGTSADRSVALLEKIVSTTGAADAGATLSVANAWAAQVLGLEATSVSSGSGGGVSRGRLL